MVLVELGNVQLLEFVYVNLLVKSVHIKMSMDRHRANHVVLVDIKIKTDSHRANHVMPVYIKI